MKMSRTMFALVVLCLGACQPVAEGDGGSAGGRSGGAGPGSGIAGGSAGGSAVEGSGGVAGGSGEGAGGGAMAGSPGESGGASGSAGAGGAVDAAPAVDASPAAPDAGPSTPRPMGPPKMVLVADDLSVPFGVAVDPITGDIYSADYGDDRIRKIGMDGSNTVVLGPGAPGAAGQVTMRNPHDLVFQPKTRNLFIGDTMGSKVLRLKVDTGEVTVIAGAGGKVPSGGNAFCLTFDAEGKTLYFTGGGGIRVVDLETETLVKTLPYSNPRVIAMDSKGTLYAVKNGGRVLQIVDGEGRATDVPGGSPVSAPKGMAIDFDDNVIIVDTESHSMLRYDITKKALERIAGNGRRGAGQLDGPPEMAQTARPHGTVVDKDGSILIADSFNDRIIAIVRK